MAGQLSRHSLARLAGGLFLAIMVTAVLAEFFIRAGLLDYTDGAAMRASLAAHEAQFRLSITLDLLCFVMIPAISMILFRLLHPVNGLAASFGLAFRMGEAITMVCVAVFSVGLLTISGMTPAASADGLDEMAFLLLRLHNGGYHFGLIFWSLGTMFFALALFQSLLVPKALSALGVFAGVSGLVAHFVWLNAPEVFGSVGGLVYLPAFLFEVGLGLWLLVFGAGR